MKQRKLPGWSRLDNAAKIFPSNSMPWDSKVFRVACELEEPADPAILQYALDRALEEFPFFQSVMKKGLFWYYLEESDFKAEASPEILPPCASVYDSNSRSLLFRVVYHGRRISLEIYHVLTDGTGALQFICTVLYYYLLKKYRTAFSSALPERILESSLWQRQEDGFQKYYEKPKGLHLSRQKNAYQLKGERLLDNRLDIIEGCMPLSSVLACAHAREVTLTELMTAVFIYAIHKEMSLRDCKRPVVITVPVNLRGYFPTESARNFFSVINVGYDFGRQQDSLEAVLAYVKRQFRESLTEEKLRERMNTLCALEHNLPMRMVPLFIKNPILRIANLAADKKITASFSNLGKITLPKEMEPYVRLFSVFTSPNMLQACACSFKNNYVVSFAGPFCRHEVERTFFSSLVNLGIDVVITTNFS